MVATFALAGGAWIFLGVIILVLVGIIFGYYTIRGSGISNTPYGKVYGGAPAAKSGDDASGKDELASQKNWSRGTK
jgi:hypothetical protein